MAEQTVTGSGRKILIAIDGSKHSQHAFECKFNFLSILLYCYFYFYINARSITVKNLKFGKFKVVNL